MVENTRGPKVHDPELNAEATRLANLAGMLASGQPWQEGAGGVSTADLLADVHPDLLPRDACDECETPCVECVGADVDEDTQDETVEADAVSVPETVAELREALTTLGVDAPAKARKGELEELYADALCADDAEG
jgi:hypothetical protein